MPRHIRIRLCSIVLLLCVFLSLTPAEAAILPIDPRQRPPTLVPPADLEKIAALQLGVVNSQILSQISPDDTLVLVAFFGGASDPAIGFLNIKTGGFRAIKIDANTPLNITSEVRWLNNNTLTYLSFDQRGNDIVVTATISDTGVTFRTRTVGLPGFGVSLGPDGKSLLVARSSSVSGAKADEDGNEAKRQSPFDLVLKKSFDNSKKAPYKGLKLDRNAFADDGDVRFSSEAVGLQVVDLVSGKVTPLYTIPTGFGLSSFDWSPDSSKIAFVRTVIPDISRFGNLLNEVASQDGLGKLPPDKNPFFLGNGVDIADITAGKVAVGALQAPGGNGDVFQRINWSTDGKSFVTQMGVPAKLKGRTYPTYIFPERSYLRFYSAADGSLIKTLDNPDIETPNSSIPFFVSPDEVIIAAVRRTDFAAFYYNVTTNEFRRLPLPAGSIQNFVATRQSRQALVPFSSFTQVPELWRINFDGTGLTQLTNNNADIAKINQVQVKEVNFTLKSGQQRAGYLIQPAGAAFPPQNAPIIFWQEGGPQSPYLNFFGTNVENPYNLLPNFGFTIAFIPFPGREGFGPAFFNGLANDGFGQIDIDEQAEVVQQMLAQGYTSRGNVGITGCSYGGYFTSQSITRYPDLYAVANSQCTLLDLFEEWQFGYTPFIFYLMGTTPTVNPDAYTKASPVYNASKVRAATLLFAGTNDFLPIKISYNFHDQIQANGAATNMYAFLREGHGLSQASSQYTAAQLQLSWFRQYMAAPPR